MPNVLIDGEYNSNLVILPGPDYIIDTGAGASIGTEDGGVILRYIVRFPLDDLPSGSTVTLAEFRVTQPNSFNVSDRTFYYGPYNGNGQADPEADDGTTQASRSDVAGDNYGSTTIHQTDGQKAFDLGATGYSDIAAAKLAVNRFSALIQPTDETTTTPKGFNVFGTGQAGDIEAPDHIPQLYLEYTEGATTTDVNLQRSVRGLNRGLVRGLF